MSDEMISQGSVTDDRTAGNLPEYARVQVVTADKVDAMSTNGWVVAKIVQVDQIMSMSKNFPYMTQGNSYPSTHNYTEDTVVRSVSFVMGCPRKLVDAEQRAEIDRLHNVLVVARKDCEDWKTKSEAATKKWVTEASDHLLTKGNVTDLENKLSERDKNYLACAEARNGAHEELRKLKEGMLRVVSRVGDANLAELLHMDEVDTEIKKSVEEPVSG